MTVKFNMDQKFDSKRMRHYLNDELSVLHCHHYSVLFTQLADDAKELRGAELLAKAAEESFYEALTKYFKKNNVKTVEDRISIAQDYFSAIGLGKLQLEIDKNGGKAEMPFSHVDEGWVKKWSKRDKPVNFMGQGFISAVCSAVNGEEKGKYKVSEVQSIVSGAKTSKFNITRK